MVRRRLNLAVRHWLETEFDIDVALLREEFAAVNANDPVSLRTLVRDAPLPHTLPDRDHCPGGGGRRRAGAGGGRPAAPGP